MNVLILMGSPRLHGNTAELCRPFVQQLRDLGAGVEYIPLAGKKIGPCRGCYACQNVEGAYGCVQQDDMQEIVRAILRADLLVLATPIYAWYCPSEMKAVLDRHYGLNKYYGTARGSLWSGKQVAILVPTTVLAWQHYETLLQRMGNFPVNIQMLSRFRSAKQRRATVRDINDGVADIVVGTHSLIQKNVKFKNLGLLIIDEEQRFGVAHKEKLVESFNGIDVLTLSATPIPRTLSMASRTYPLCR